MFVRNRGKSFPKKKKQRKQRRQTHKEKARGSKRTLEKQNRKK